MTHCAWLWAAPCGTWSVLPAGQLVLGELADDTAVPTSTFETLTPENSATAPIAAASVVPIRTRRRTNLGILRTKPPHNFGPPGLRGNLRATGYVNDDVVQQRSYSSVTESRTVLW
jgi:hypothetical protein